MRAGKYLEASMTNHLLTIVRQKSHSQYKTINRQLLQYRTTADAKQLSSPASCSDAGKCLSSTRRRWVPTVLRSVPRTQSMKVESSFRRRKAQ